MVFLPVALFFTLWTVGGNTQTSDNLSYTRMEYCTYSYDMPVCCGTGSYYDANLSNWNHTSTYIITNQTIFTFKLYSNSSDDYMLELHNISFDNTYYVNGDIFGNDNWTIRNIAYQLYIDGSNHICDVEVDYSVFDTNPFTLHLQVRDTDDPTLLNYTYAINDMFFDGEDYVFEDPINIFNTEVGFESGQVSKQIEEHLSQVYNTNYLQGYSDGYTSGYSDGERTGFNTGYTDGYNDGSSQDEVATSIFIGIINVALLPINMFLSMLNFEVFGINIGGFVSALLTIAIVVIIMRIVVSGGNKSDS